MTDTNKANGARRSRRGMLMDGEDSATRDPEVARHWVSIYGQMLEFKERMIDRIRNEADGLPRPAGSHVRSTDLRIMEAERERVVTRLDFWRDRHWQLARIDLDPDGRTVTYRGHVVDLTQRELQLMDLLLKTPNRYVPAQQVLAAAWGDPGLAPEQVRSYITRLRRKLSDAAIPCRVETRPRRGYRLVFD